MEYIDCMCFGHFLFLIDNLLHCQILQCFAFYRAYATEPLLCLFISHRSETKTCVYSKHISILHRRYLRRRFVNPTEEYALPSLARVEGATTTTSNRTADNRRRKKNGNRPKATLR